MFTNCPSSVPASITSITHCSEQGDLGVICRGTSCRVGVPDLSLWSDLGLFQAPPPAPGISWSKAAHNRPFGGTQCKADPTQGLQPSTPFSSLCQAQPGPRDPCPVPVSRQAAPGSAARTTPAPGGLRPGRGMQLVTGAVVGKAASAGIPVSSHFGAGREK